MADLRAITIRPHDFWVESWCPWRRDLAAQVLASDRVLVAYGPESRIPSVKSVSSLFVPVLNILLNQPRIIEIVDRKLIEDAIEYYRRPRPKTPKKRSFPFEVDREVFVQDSDRDGNQVVVLKNNAPWDAKEAWNATLMMCGSNLKGMK